MVLDKDVHTLVNVCMAAECSICVADDRDVQRCPLREAMYHIAPPLEETKFGCEYRNIVVDNLEKIRQDEAEAEARAAKKKGKKKK